MRKGEEEKKHKIIDDVRVEVIKKTKRWTGLERMDMPISRIPYDDDGKDD